MNGAARTVILKAIVQLEAERHLLLRRSDALAAEIRDCEARIGDIAAERSDLLTVTGDLSTEERVMVASAVDFPAPSPKAAARGTGRPRKRATTAAAASKPTAPDLKIITADYSVAAPF